MVEDSIAKIQHYPGIGELTVGGGREVLWVALCMLNDPLVNQYLLDSLLRLEDRMTKTRVFPRVGMALPNGQFYEEEEESE